MEGQRSNFSTHHIHTIGSGEVPFDKGNELRIAISIGQRSFNKYYLLYEKIVLQLVYKLSNVFKLIKTAL